ncbi:MAG: hypothetical protein M1819_000757 [Sarea resinae]|nr:MAG: hypothetical protein M1819_000757 [Sarea resinae]
MAARRQVEQLRTNTKPWAACAVRVKIHPRPRSVRESREVLRELEQFGEVVTYRNLKYENRAPAPNNILAIYRHEQAASSLLAASPLRFTLGPHAAAQIQSGQHGTSEQEGKAGDSTASSSSSGEDHSLSSEKAAEKREFHIAADRSYFDHQAYIQGQFMHGQFSPSLKDAAALDLASSVPFPGLVDLSKERGDMPKRLLFKRQEAVAARKSLKQLWQQGSIGKGPNN